MFFILSKILAFSLSPITWVAVLLLLAVFSRKKARRARRFYMAATAVLLVFSNTFILDEAMRAWEVPTKDLLPQPSYEYGIVLGGMASYDAANDRINFHRGTDRLLQAVELYNKGRIKKLFISGGAGSLFDQEIKESMFLKDYLVRNGIPEEDIEIEYQSKNTRENAQYTAEILQPQSSPKKYLLISSAVHLRRASACFRKAGFEVDNYPVDRYSGKRKFGFAHLFVPQAWALVSWDALMHEIVGYVTYAAIGYV